jgi:hypothetical protein
MYCLETVSRPNLSMLMGEDPAGVKVLEAFHKRIGRPECHLTFGDSFSLQIEKGQTLKEALTVADEDLRHPDGVSDLTPEQDASARHHVPKLLAHL